MLDRTLILEESLEESASPALSRDEACNAQPAIIKKMEAIDTSAKKPPRPQMKKSSSGVIKVFRFEREPGTSLANDSTQSRPYAMMAAASTERPITKMRPRLNSADVSPFETARVPPARKCTFDFSRGIYSARKASNSSSSDTSGKKRKNLADDQELDSIS